MLLSLQVRNFAIIDEIDVDVGAGMTVLTGETGAGKSILVDALGLILGERGGSGLVREGAGRAEFSAEFDVADLPAVQAWLEEQALDMDGECLLRRVVAAEGRSRAFVNGNAVTLQTLKALGELLADIHGQQFHQSLGRRDVQRQLLDHFGGLQPLCTQTGDAFEAWRALRAELEALQDAEADREARLDLLEFQVGELDRLDLAPGELGELTAERHKLQNVTRLAEGLSQILLALYDGDENTAHSLVSTAGQNLQELAAVDEELDAAVSLVEEAGIQIGEAVGLLRGYAESLEADPARRDWVEERLHAAQTIARKHRVEPEALGDVQVRLRDELDALRNAGERGESLARDAAAARSRYLELAGRLSAERSEAAARFAADVTAAMSGLGMPGGAFEIAVTRRDESGAAVSGMDDVEYRISANPGQPLMPLAKVASGGELSRMSLAVQVVASDGSEIRTMVFDEVDSGVGGGIAEMVGRRLCELGASRQVLCVTHLPQVASQADHHLRISKVTDGQSTRTGIKRLTADERKEELARMLGGVEITRRTREHAAEMLAAGGRKTTPKRRLRRG